MSEKLSFRAATRKIPKSEVRRLAQAKMGRAVMTKALSAELGLPWPLPRGWQYVVAGFVSLQSLPAFKEQRQKPFARKAKKERKPTTDTEGEKRDLLKSSGKDDFYSSWERKRVRYEALAKFEHRCQCCGWQPGDTSRGYLVVDHIKPRRKFPSLALDVNNLQVLCNDCNMGKGHVYQDDFRMMDEAFKIMLAH